jgi:hypothetical protein
MSFGFETDKYSGFSHLNVLDKLVAAKTDADRKLALVSSTTHRLCKL